MMVCSTPSQWAFPVCKRQKGTRSSCLCCGASMRPQRPEAQEAVPSLLFSLLPEKAEGRGLCFHAFHSIPACNSGQGGEDPMGKQQMGLGGNTGEGEDGRK